MSKSLVILSSLPREALEAVHSAILVADAQASDQPIVYMNPAFEALTGYGEAEVLGRNCRFLQGERTDPEAVASIRRALEEDRPVREVLLNYRKSGAPFYNEIFINQIRDAEGRTTHLVGCQNETVSPEAASLQAAARDLAATLSAREREVFEGLVRGERIKEIARRAGLSPRTVEKYRYRMQDKMNTSSLAMLVRYAIALGLDFDSED